MSSDMDLDGDMNLLSENPKLFMEFIETNVLSYANVRDIQHAVFDMVTWMIYRMRPAVFDSFLNRIVSRWNSLEKKTTKWNTFILNHVFFQHFFANIHRLHVLFPLLQSISKKKRLSHWVVHSEELVLRSLRFSTMLFNTRSIEFCEVKNCRNVLKPTKPLKYYFPNYKPREQDTLYRQLCPDHANTSPEDLVFRSPPRQWDKYILSTKWVYVDAGPDALSRSNDVQPFYTSSTYYPTAEMPCYTVDDGVPTICNAIYQKRDQLMSASLRVHVESVYNYDFKEFISEEVKPLVRTMLERLHIDQGKRVIPCYYFVRADYHPSLHIIIGAARTH